MAPKTIAQALKIYKQVITQKIPEATMFVFGSVAKGTAEKNSDIDVMVVAQFFQNMPELDRLVFLSKLRSGAARKVAMDIVGFTPEEIKKFRKEKNIFARNIFANLKKII